MFGVAKARVCVVVAILMLIFPATAQALGDQPVISQIKTGDSGFAAREYISMYNNSSGPIDVTGWCVQYASSSDVTKTTLACLAAPEANIKLFVEPFGHVRFASEEFRSAVSGFSPDGIFSSGLSGTGGHIRLLDSAKNEVDKIGWGTAVSPEESAAAVHASGLILQRKGVPGSSFLVDLNDNFTDFESAVLETIPASGLYEEEQEIDICQNLQGIQTEAPDDYFPKNGDCLQDQCDNLEGLQETIPSGFESLDGENCSEIPLNQESSILHISELLPNAKSTDTGKEFIEIYNPNDRAVELEGYRLELGPLYSKAYTLKKQLLQPFSFAAFSDNITGLVLPNTLASLRLVAPAGNIVSETEEYSSPKEDASWAMINELWQYSGQPTPGTLNVLAVSIPEEEEVLVPCPEGKYRSPETNRCRNIETGDVELRPCEAGQTRNPETNRCRAVSSNDGLIPCREGQERNPETNRCRNIISSASALLPCDPGEERNPETNRCRKASTLGASTLADVKDIPSATKGNSFSWLAIAAVGLFAIAYAAYEWRSELARAMSRLRSFRR